MTFDGLVPPGEVTLSLGDSLPADKEGLVCFVRDGWIALWVWNDVPVIRVRRRGLTIVERFLLEASLVLPVLSADEIHGLTSIPKQAVRRIARRLSSAQALLALPDGGFKAVEHQTASVLQAQVVEEAIPGRLSFVYLPRTDDLLAFDPEGGGASPPKIEHLQSVALAPVPQWAAGRGKFAMLAERVRNRKVAHLPDDVREVVMPEKGDECLPEKCPSFHCAGSIIEQNEGSRINLNLYGYPCKRKGKKRRDEPDMVSVPIILDGAEGLLQRWMSLSEALEGEANQMKAWKKLAPRGTTPARVLRRGPLRWAYLVDRPTAEALAKALPRAGQSLATKHGIGICSESGETLVLTSVEFTVSGETLVDRAAARPFVLDDVVQRLQTESEAIVPERIEVVLAEAEAAALRGLTAGRVEGGEPPITASDVLDRLWTLGHYRLIYELREAEDFHYD